MNFGCPQAVKENPHDAELFARRAAAHLKLKEYIEAANDASKSIELDPQAYRGYLMKG
jgi:suppressor of G2 allele of SKP1